MLIEIPPKISAPSFIGYLKENSSTMINEQLGELRYKIQELGFRRRGYYMYNQMRLIQEHKLGRRVGTEEYWGYCVDTAGKNAKKDSGVYPEAAGGR